MLNIKQTKWDKLKTYEEVYCLAKYLATAYAAEPMKSTIGLSGTDDIRVLLRLYRRRGFES